MDSAPSSSPVHDSSRARRPLGKRYRQEVGGQALDADEAREFLRRPGTIPPLKVPVFDRLALPLPLEAPKVAETLGLPGAGTITARPDAQAMRERYASGELEATLEAAEALLRHDPLEPEARHYADRCRDELARRFRARLGSGRLALRVPLARLQSHGLEPRHAFVLSRLEGLETVDEVLDVCPMPAHEALRVLCELVDRRILSTA